MQKARKQEPSHPPPWFSPPPPHSFAIYPGLFTGRSARRGQGKTVYRSLLRSIEVEIRKEAKGQSSLAQSHLIYVIPAQAGIQPSEINDFFLLRMRRNKADGIRSACKLFRLLSFFVHTIKRIKRCGKFSGCLETHALFH
jgi:hypothetical protein